MHFIKVIIIKIINLSLIFNLFLIFINYLKTLFKFILNNNKSNNNNAYKLIILRFIILIFIKAVFKK